MTIYITYCLSTSNFLLRLYGISNTVNRAILTLASLLALTVLLSLLRACFQRHTMLNQWSINPTINFSGLNPQANAKLHVSYPRTAIVNPETWKTFSTLAALEIVYLPINPGIDGQKKRESKGDDDTSLSQSWAGDEPRQSITPQRLFTTSSPNICESRQLIRQLINHVVCVCCTYWNQINMSLSITACWSHK